MTADTAWYLNLRRQDVVSDAILVGDPARLGIFAEYLSSVRRLAREREFASLAGEYEGRPVMVVATGIGAPSLTIAVEELASLGVRRVARVGTTLARTVPLGSLVLAQAAVRLDGTSARYAPPFVPAVPDPELYAAFRNVLAAQHTRWAEGVVASSDAFYADMFPLEGTPAAAEQADLERWGVVSLDMETSALYVVARLRRLAAVSLCAATVRQVDGYRLPTEERVALEHVLVKTSLEALAADARGAGTGTAASGSRKR